MKEMVMRFFYLLMTILTVTSASTCKMSKTSGDLRATNDTTPNAKGSSESNINLVTCCDLTNAYKAVKSPRAIDLPINECHEYGGKVFSQSCYSGVCCDLGDNRKDKDGKVVQRYMPFNIGACVAATGAIADNSNCGGIVCCKYILESSDHGTRTNIKKVLGASCDGGSGLRVDDKLCEQN